MGNSERWETASHDPGDLRREMQEGHGGKLLNMLVGLIINSNDAYERAGISKSRKILVDIDKTKVKDVGDNSGKARIRVIDWAQGMDYEDFGKNFKSYGGVKSEWQKGKKISGLFGREASDIMWCNVASTYICIKKAAGYACQFRPLADFRRYTLDSRATAHFKKEFDANESLTIAEFHLDQDYSLPHFDTLTNGLRKHFRLRLINQNPDIEVALRFRQTKTRTNNITISFDPLENEGAGAELLDKQDFYMSYKNYPKFKVEASLFKKLDRDLTQTGIDREGGLLIYADDDTVLELSLLNFDEVTYTAYNRRFFGYVKLHIAEIIRQELRNASQRLALIEVDRSQMRHRNSELYDNLKKTIDGWMRKYIEQEQASTSSVRSQLTAAWNQKLKPIFAEINQVALEKTGETGKIIKGEGTAPEIMNFTRNKIATSEGTVYRLELLFNTAIIPPGSTFTLSSDNNSIYVDPLSDIVPVANHEHFVNVARKTIRIWAEKSGEQAIITAYVQGFDPATVNVLSVEAQIHVPSIGLEWWPNDFDAIDNEVSHPTLWVDLNAVDPQGSIILNSKASFVNLIDTQIPITKVQIVKEDIEHKLLIGRVRPRFRASGLRLKAQISAIINSQMDELNISQVPVVEEGNVVGMIDRGSLIHLMQIRNELRA